MRIRRLLLLTAALVLPLGLTASAGPEDLLGEYVDAGGTPCEPDPKRSLEEQSLRRNPNMPLIWSDPPKLYRP